MRRFWLVLIFCLMVGGTTYAADVKISELPSATAPTGSEIVPVVQGGETRKATIQQIINTAGSTAYEPALGNPGADGWCVKSTMAGVRSWGLCSGSMVYPGVGIPLSTGSAWGTSITDNSANWNTAFGWGNHASGGYLTSESDPQVDAVTSGNFCKGTGTTVSCTDSGTYSATSHNHSGTYVESESDPLALLTAGTDNVKDTHIDWGAGAGQVNAADVPFTPSGNIAAATVDGAIQEMDSEKLAASAMDDTAYAAGWDADTTHVPTKNAVYDEIKLRLTKAAPSFTGVMTGNGLVLFNADTAFSSGMLCTFDGVKLTGLATGAACVVAYDSTGTLGCNENVSVSSYEVDPVPISWAIDGGTAPGALTTLTSTNKARYRDFSGSANNDVFFEWQVPYGISLGFCSDPQYTTQATCETATETWTATLPTFQVEGWITSATGPADGETLKISLACASYADTEILSGALGSAVTVTKTFTTGANWVQYDRVTTGYSTAVTVTGLAGGELVICTLTRDTTDTYAQPFGVGWVKIKYAKTTQGS